MKPRHKRILYYLLTHRDVMKVIDREMEVKHRELREIKDELLK